MALMTVCRACKSDRMNMFLPLGDQPPANAFISPDQLGCPEPALSLDTHVCLECGLIQVPNVIPPDFFREYVYVPSSSDTMHEHFTGLASVVRNRLIASPDDLVVDIGSNDGLFLWKLAGLGVRGLGIEPARNLTEIARARGVEVVNEYFTPATARIVHRDRGPAKVIVTTNTFNHIDDLHDFMAAVRILLAGDGTFVIEVPHAGDLVAQNEFDTVYHEHVSEFTVKSIAALFAFFDMRIVDIERLPIHGGSMRVFGRRTPAGPLPAVVARWLAAEEQAGLFSAETYAAFARRVQDIRTRLLTLLRDLKAQGWRLAGYGASAKGNTLLNYCGIGPDTLMYLADRNSLKHGLYSPGMHLPVVPVDRILQDQPDYLLILAWNFGDEIMRQQEEYRRRGGKFIVPIPEPRTVG
jgi:SAM-dependent methyltransferase